MLPPKNVLVPIDFSDGSTRALDAARDLVGEDGVIQLIYVLEHLSALHPGMVWETFDDAERLDHARRALVKLCADRDLDAEVAVATTVGNPAMEVARFAKDAGVDAIVVASHGRTGIARVALGSVAERIVRYASCPVVVIKSQPPEDD